MLVQSVCLLFIMGNGCIWFTEGGSKIKYFLQEGMLGGGSFLAKPLEPAHLDTSLACRTLYSVLFLWGVVVMGSRA